MPEFDYEEDFIFTLIKLNKYKGNIKEVLHDIKHLEGDVNIYIWEKITKKPKTLIIIALFHNIHHTFLLKFYYYIKLIIFNFYHYII